MTKYTRVTPLGKEIFQHVTNVLHASGNAATKLTSELIPKDAELTGLLKVLDSGWINFIAFSIVAIVHLVLTRSTFGYRSGQADVGNLD